MESSLCAIQELEREPTSTGRSGDSWLACGVGPGLGLPLHRAV